MDTFPQQHSPHPNQFVIAQGGGEPDEPGFDFWGVLSRRKWLVFLGLVCGMALGGLYGAQCEDVYLSEAKVRIEPKDPMVIFQTVHQKAMLPGAKDLAIRHDQLIGQPNIVQRCLSEKGLDGLRSFKDIPADKRVSSICDKLEITQNKEEVMLYDLQYYSSRPDDAQTLLNNLIATYEKELEEQYKDESENVETLIKTLHSEFETNYKRLQTKKSDLLGQLKTAVVTDGGMNFHQVKVASISKELADARNYIGALSEDLKRAQQYIGRTDAEIEAYVWILENQKKIIVREEEPRIRDERLVENAKIKIADLKMQQDEIAQRLGPGHYKYQAITNSIEQFQRIIAEESGPIEADAKTAPGEILRRYLRSLQQQIADNRLIIDRLSPELTMHHAEALKIAANARDIKAVDNEMADVKEFMQTTKQKLIDIGFW